MSTLAKTDRASFAADQAQMGDDWYENLKNSGVDVDQYLAGRRAAYMDRWREAGRFIADGSRILDIGGGNTFEELLNYYKSRKLDYWYLDIGEAEVEASGNMAASLGLNKLQFFQGFNDHLIFEDNFFDAVFSSHCIEHSIDLASTFRELNRVIKSGGNLLMAVPFGWELQPAHPYFFSTDEWVCLVQDAGFEIRVFQTGCEYPEQGYDLFIAARKVGPVREHQRILPENYLKPTYSFMSFDDPRIKHFGQSDVREEYVIMDGKDWEIRVNLEAGVSEILPIFMRHDWSGIIRLQCGNDESVEDLHSLQTYAQPARLRLSAPLEEAGVMSIKPIGRHDASWSMQGVFVGVMYR